MWAISSSEHFETYCRLQLRTRTSLLVSPSSAPVLKTVWEQVNAAAHTHTGQSLGVLFTLTRKYLLFIVSHVYYVIDSELERCVG